MAMSPNLPPELQYRVLSSLNPKDALACALVCRDWVAESRKIALSRAIGLTTKWGAHQADKFIDLLIHPYSTVRRHLSHITVDFAVLPIAEVMRVVDALVDHGSRVQTLRIERMETVRQGHIQDPVLRLISHHLPYLQCLDLYHCTPTPDFVRALMEILSTAPSLTNLIMHVEFAGYALFKTAPPPPPPSLRSVETNLFYPIFFETWVFKADHVLRYKIIGDMFDITDILCDFKATNREAVGLHGRYHIHTYSGEKAKRFFSSPQCARTLTHLTVLLRQYNFADLDLGMAVNLESLHIEIDLKCGTVYFDLHTTWLRRTLQTTRTGVTADLELRVWCDTTTTTCEAIRELDKAVTSFVGGGAQGLKDVKMMVGGLSHTNIKFLLCEVMGREASTFAFNDIRC